MPTGSTTVYSRETGAESVDHVEFHNDTDVSNEQVWRALQDQHPEIAQLSRWMSGNQSRQQGIFQRDKYMIPEGIFAEMRLAQYAATTDDVVSGVLETTEQLAINKLVIETGDEDEDDIWRQIIFDIDLEARMRELWRETFTCSNAYAAVLMGKKPTMKVRGKSDKGITRKKTYSNLVVPLGLSILDPLKVLPVGNFMFGQERLAFVATPVQSDIIEETLAGSNSSDLVFSQLIEGKYNISQDERSLLSEITGDQIPLDRLYVMDRRKVFRVTSTRPAYERFAQVRMKSIFELLDMKAQLRQLDRAYLIGGTNMIILVKKGSDHQPAKPGEVSALANQIKQSSRVPIIVGDHRMEVEIVTPKLDKTLTPERYNAIDSRITARLYQILSAGNYAAGTANDDSLKLIRVISRSMEARRNDIRRAIMAHVILLTFEANEELKNEPNLKFYPSRIGLDFDPNLAQYLLDLRTMGEISRHTALAEADVDEAEEAAWREREQKWDKLFVPPEILNAPPAPEGGVPGGTKLQGKSPGAKSGGRQGGGNSNGGGANGQSRKSGPARGPAKPEAKSDAPAKAEEDESQTLLDD